MSVDAILRDPGTLQGAKVSKGGELAVGERLPPERELAERYGVNRVTIRGALGRLSAARLIRTRQGSGHVVRDYLRVGGPDLLGGLLAGLLVDRGAAAITAIVRDLLRVRRHLARGVLEAFAERSDPPSIEGVREAIERFAAVADEDPSPERLADADVEVFAASGKATLYSYVISQRSTPGHVAPFAIAVVELAEGPRMMTNIVGCEQTLEVLELDMDLAVTFEQCSDTISLPQFKPVAVAQ